MLICPKNLAPKVFCIDNYLGGCSGDVSGEKKRNKFPLKSFLLPCADGGGYKQGAGASSVRAVNGVGVEGGSDFCVVPVGQADLQGTSLVKVPLGLLFFTKESKVKCFSLLYFCDYIHST